MSGGTLVVSRAENLFPYYRKELESLGFRDTAFTCAEKDGLNAVINEYNPGLLLVGSCFYKAGTPYMMGRLADKFEKLNIAAVNIHEFPDGFAPWFVWQGVKSYANMQDGMEEFKFGLNEIRKGRPYISPPVKEILENTEPPEINKKADRRQMEVLTFLCNGVKPLEIGSKLHISKRTVDWHIEELCKTFCVHTRDELVGVAFYLEIVSKDDLCFFDRKNKTGPLPKWAAVKRAINRNRTAAGG